jgi:hypothetical protein
MKLSLIRKDTVASGAFPSLPLNDQIRIAQIGALRILPHVAWYPPDLWRNLGKFKPGIVAGSQHALRRFCQHVRLCNIDVNFPENAIYCLTSLGERPMTDDLRDELWEMFGVPLFEIFVGGDGQILARECEAHEGWHVNTHAADFMRLEGDPHLVIQRKCAGKPFYAMGLGFGGDVTNELCPCGFQTPRLINLPTEELWQEEKEELLYAAL